MAQRKLKDWLEAYVHYNRNSEAPTSYHIWSGISTIAAVLQRKVHIYWHPNRIYPNNYVVLVGPSGQSRKGDAISSARQILEGINIRLLGEDNSPESIIKDMGSEENRLIYTDSETGNHVTHSSISCFAEELAVFTGQQNATFLAYLTNWYDSRDLWTRKTKHQGIDEIVGMCFNFLVSTAPDWLPGILTRESIGGGFTSRCIFIVEEGKRQTITDPNKNRPNSSERRDLKHDLEIIQTLTGQYRFSEEALKRYENWYKDSDGIFKKSGNPLGPLFNGYYSRRPTHIKKIAISLSASRNSQKIIELQDFNKALKMLEKAEEKMPAVFSGVGRSRYAEDIDSISSYIKVRGRVSQGQILRDFYRNLDMDSLEAIMKILRGMGSIKIEQDTGSKEIWYLAL